MARNGWSLVFAMGLTVYMATLDQSIVAVALPTIEEQFGTTTSVTEWVALAYLLPLIALVLPGPLMSLVMGAAPAQLMGTVGASTQLTRQLGFALGPAVATAVWAVAGYSPAGMRAAVALSTAATLLALGSLIFHHRTRTTEEVVSS